MTETIETALRHTLKVEGAFVDHPADPGGATKFGITQRTLSAWLERPATTDDVRNLEWETAKAIYRQNYWEPIRAEELPPALAILTFDVAVNSGIKAAITNLQRALNHGGASLISDGIIGNKTINAASRYTTTKQNLTLIIDEYVVKRGIFYTMLDTFGVFGLGWARRLVSTARLAYELAAEQFPEEGTGSSTETDALSPAHTAASSALTRYFMNDGAIQTYGSFFRLWDGWVSAGHVFTEMNRKAPPFATGSQIIAPAFLDVALFGITPPTSRPKEPVIGQKVLAMGYPAGSSTPEVREGVIYHRRSSENFITRITSPREPVVVGMSGGIVIDVETNEPVGIIVVRNSPADLDQDGIKDESFDFVALSDVYDAITPPHPIG